MMQVCFALTLILSAMVASEHVLLEVEVSVSVIVRNILDHLVDEFHFTLRKLSVLDVLSDKVAEDAAEILVTRV